ncbi:hypothetical protein I4U23_005813 [Adineta vaga]|nr:hypothetical protein I4U23_005813 [Adineta vaga]
MSTTKIRVCQSIVNLMKTFTNLYKINVGYEQKSSSDSIIDTCINKSEKMFNDVWTKKEGFQTIKTVYETILTTVDMTLAEKSDRIKQVKKVFQYSFEIIAQNIIEDYRQQTKQYFMSDLYSIVIDEINKHMLLQRIEPLHATRVKTLRELYTMEISMTRSLKTIKIFEKVAKEFNMSLPRLVQYLTDKNKRNYEVHKAENFIRHYSQHCSNDEKEKMELSTFLRNHSEAFELAQFTTEEIQETQQVFFKYNQYINLEWKNKMRPTEHLWITRKNISRMDQYEVGIYVQRLMNDIKKHQIRRYDHNQSIENYDMKEIRKFKV